MLIFLLHLITFNNTASCISDNLPTKMAIFLVDLEFREKAKNLLTSKELLACVLFLLFALVPWVEVIILLVFH